MRTFTTGIAAIGLAAAQEAPCVGTLPMECDMECADAPPAGCNAREKTLCAASVDLMVSDHAKEMGNAVALIAMKIAKRQQLNQQQRSRQRGLPPLLDQLNRQPLSTLPRASLRPRAAQAAEVDQSVAVPTVQTSSPSLASLFSRKTGNISTWIFGSMK